MNQKIAIVGEAWGAEEARQLTPFVGPSGYALTTMLEDAGIHRADCFLTNCFNFQPRPTNDIGNLCGPKRDDRTGYPPLSSGKYIRAEFLPELERLRGELRELRPHITVALGGTASWALLGQGGISKIRGTAAYSSEEAPAGVDGLKIIPTYHPAAVLRDWSLRPVTVMDLVKAKREAEFPEIRRPNRRVWIEPTLADLPIILAVLREAERISFDIETAGDQITCIGFAPSADVAYVIPFVDRRRPGNNYWESAHAELVAWKFVKQVLNLPCEKIAQNGLYDIHYLWRRYGISVRNAAHDTMLLAHAIQPELPKGLGFLASVYTNEASWKMMRNKEADTRKKEDV